MSERVLTVSSSPHVRSKQSTMSVMRDVLIALAPASILSIVFFGWKSLLLIVLCIAASVATEAGMQKFMKKEITVRRLVRRRNGAFACAQSSDQRAVVVAVIGSVLRSPSLNSCSAG
jgi:electron transport complex protein RnfD